MKPIQPMSHLAYITDFHFELPWPEQSLPEIADRQAAFMAVAQLIPYFELVYAELSEPVTSLCYRVVMKLSPSGDATALVRIGMLGDKSTYGIAIELNMEHCFLEDAEFLIDTVTEMVGPDLAAMRAAAKITRLGTSIDLLCCHMKQLNLSGTDDDVKLMKGTMARFSPAAIARAGLVSGSVTVAQVDNVDQPIVRIRTLQDLRLPIAEVGALPSPLVRLKFGEPNAAAKLRKAKRVSSSWQWEPVKYWEDLLWNIHYTTAFSATELNLKPVWFDQ